jgi:hypothetical protein
LHVVGEIRSDYDNENGGTAINSIVHHDASYSYTLWSTSQNSIVFMTSGVGWCWTMVDYYTGSDSKFKRNITSIDSPLMKLMRLNGIEYNFANNNKVDTTKRRLGLIAQDVEKIVPGVVKTMPDSSKAIAYSELTGLIIEAIKELNFRIDSLESVVSSQTAIIQNCCKKSQFLSEPDKNKQGTNNNNDDAKLYPNVPNPFNEKTEIMYKIPVKTTEASLIIYNLQGIAVKSYDIKQSGVGKIVIDGNELSAGMYMYSLLIENKIVDTKTMILTTK